MIGTEVFQTRHLSFNVAGTNRQLIFEEMVDCAKFLADLGEAKPRSGFELAAYCMMRNQLARLSRLSGLGRAVVTRMCRDASTG